MTDTSIHYECDLFEWAEKNTPPPPPDFLEGAIEFAELMFERYGPYALTAEEQQSKMLSNRVGQSRRRYNEQNPHRTVVKGKRFNGNDILEIYEIQDGRCCYCGMPFDDDYQIDHVMPLSRGGTNNPDNIALSCSTCNFAKHNHLMDEWMTKRGW